MIRLFLIGYMGVGKTTLGKALGKALNVEFIDLDKYIEHCQRKTVPELFEEQGEIGFRLIEQKMLKEVSTFENVVISTGGGAPCFFDNMQVMNNAGVTIYLKAEPQELAARLRAAKGIRPIIAGKTEEELIPFIEHHLNDREQFYSRAQIIFESKKLVTPSDVDNTVNNLIEQLNKV
ncbi:MAG: shikimate kinase [Dysgonamonadaceae bacterium]|jgi:shikimate kinase|nr:shikimate kinase [Dysgonamonadaceae bacterium]MDD3308519.1 shikimate kinase [Dysgonamonadaceae bacterium]MDD3899920.1 shikimate kinase [Dysgonamonadaceae bacterium]MDD4398721.1 shikimate kinase [Dysgonamonadaceae bacterium]MEA5081415.1 shikimate kinase [Dysgonamonadaceae bacterium]